MKDIAAIHLVTSGEKPYEHGLLSIGGCLLTDGGFSEEIELFIQPNGSDSFIPTILEYHGLSMQFLYEEGMDEPKILSILRDWKSTTEQSWFWSFDSIKSGAFLAKIFRRSEINNIFYNSLVSAIEFYRALEAVKGERPKFISDDLLLKQLGINRGKGALEMAKACALAIKVLHLNMEGSGVHRLE